MKVVDILRLGYEILQTLQESCIKIEDLRYLDMYEDYVRMRDAGGKMSYIVATLVETYHVSERQVYYVIKKFSQDCNIGAV